MLDLVVQIVNYKTKKYLSDCIDGVLGDLKTSNISFKILILENDSGDNLADLEEKYKDKQISFYYSDKNLGFGGGHNLLSKKAESKFLLFLNADIKFIESKTVERIVEFAVSLKRDVIAGPLLMSKDGIQPWDHGELKGFKSWLTRKTGSSYWRERNKVGEVAWVSGAFFLISKQIFDKLGGFDEKFFLYKEEEDLCLRAMKLGYKIFYNPFIKVFHYGSVVASKDIFFDASDKYFYQKHFENRSIASYLMIKIFKKIRGKILGY